MGRRVKLYSKQLERVRGMGPGDVVKFKAQHPWGLAHRIYAMMKKYMISDYYNVSVSTEKGVVTVKKENTNYGFVWEYDYMERGGVN